MFLRAHRLARDMGTRHLELVALYQYAWTTYWYFEDVTTFNVLYGQIDDLARGTENTYELRLLHTLWTMLRTLVTRGRLGSNECRLPERTANLTAELNRIASDEGRLSASLEAKTFLALMDLFDLANAPAIEAAFGNLRDIALKAVGLVGYPLKRLARMVCEFGEPPGPGA